MKKQVKDKKYTETKVCILLALILVATLALVQKLL